MNTLRSYSKKYLKNQFNPSKTMIIKKFMGNFKSFSTLTTTNQAVAPPKRSYGGLKDSDRIFTNLYRDNDPFIEGAMKRVSFLKFLII